MKIAAVVYALLLLGLCGASAQDEKTSPNFDVKLPSGEKLPPVEYFKKPAYRQFSISPNGRYLAFVEDIPFAEAYRYQLEKQDEEEEERRKNTISLTDKVYGERVLIYDFEMRKVIALLPFFEREVYWTHWANDDRILVSASVTFALNYGNILTFELPAARTLSFDWRTGEFVVLFGEDRAIQRQNLFLSNIVDPLPNDRDHVLVAAYRRGDLDLWRVNITTGDSDRVGVGKKGTFAWIADRNGEPVFRMDENRSGSAMRVFARNDNGRWSKIATAPLNDNGESYVFQPISKGETDNEVYILATPEGENFATIKAFDTSTASFTRTVASAAPFDVGGGLIDDNTGEYLGAWYLEDRRRVMLNDETLQRHIDGINIFFDGDANVQLLAASKEYSKLVISVSSPTLAGDVYIYDFSRTHLEPLFPLYPNLDGVLSPVEVVDYEARDGLRLRGYITHPRGIAADEFAPLIIMPHGGPASRDYYGFGPYAQFIASRGYRVFQPNFRGSSGYGAAFRQAGYGEWGGAMQEDLMDGVAYLKARGLAEPGRICILGGSYGGYAALYGAMTAPDVFACAVSMAGVSDLPDLLKYERKGASNADVFDLVVQQIGHPRNDREMLEARSPARHPEKLAVPLLIIHGKQDRVVPYEQSYNLMKALDEAEIEYEWLALNDDHYFSELSSKVQSMKKIEAFLEKHLGNGQ